jgi:hypothetical protein
MIGRNAEAQAIEEGAGAEHAIVPRAGADDIGERFRGIGDRRYDGAYSARNDVAIDPAFVSSSRNLPSVSSPPAFSLRPTVIITSPEPPRSS